ncbi:hypothetical protein BRD00_04415 [Halobacteriales archaeon QS_8_69_26]|nr:MAG: hypothetical protein BRD00_04415 [Halobacteriales archaeon QS_8_69_26]
MRVRGRRECKECGTRWSYYETGSIHCPSCGSIRSVGVDEERRLHTDGPAALDLTPVRERFDRDPIGAVTDDAKECCREYVRRRGFVRGGELLDLDDGYLAAAELLHVADVVGRSFDPDDREELYLLELLRGADAGERPDPGDVPDSMRAARGLAYANAVRDYRRELREWLEDRDEDDRARQVPAVRETLGQLDDHAKRIRALEGDVDPQTVERLVLATRDLAEALRDGDEDALATARDRLARIDGA